MPRKIIDIILWKEGFYPFSMKYDPRKAIQSLENSIEEMEFDITAKSVLQYGKMFNDYFLEICTTLQSILAECEMDKGTLVELIISGLNREEIIISKDTENLLLAKGVLDRNFVSNVHIKKPEFQNITESSWGLIDAAIDTAILNLNYLNYVKLNNSQIENEKKQVDIIRKLSMIGSAFNAIKQAYDRVIWRGYSIEHSGNRVLLKSDKEHLMLDNVALTRLSRNNASTQDELESGLKKHTELYKYYFKTRRYEKILSIKHGEESLELKYQSIGSNPSFSYYGLLAPLLTYYPFYQSNKITKFDDLTILDLVNMFSILFDLIDCLPLPLYEDTGIVDFDKMKKFNPSIKRKELVSHFKKVTKYRVNQIDIFIDLLTQKGSQYNLYLHPILAKEDELFFCHSIIKRANVLYLVDKWLDVGACDLATRGYAFEDYIRSILMHQKMNEFAVFEIISTKLFSFTDSDNARQEEEIDLIIKTKSSFLLAEIKCAMYPLNPDDFYASLNVVKKAKSQVSRKLAFIEENWSEFENVLGKREGRDISSVIITNFPHYAGRKIEGVPIVDFYLFLSYFISGNFIKMKLQKGSKPEVISYPYYDSIDTFSKNMSSFFHTPFPICDLISRQSIEEYEVTVTGSIPAVIAERVIYEPYDY